MSTPFNSLAIDTRSIFCDFLPVQPLLPTLYWHKEDTREFLSRYLSFSPHIAANISPFVRRGEAALCKVKYGRAIVVTFGGGGGGKGRAKGGLRVVFGPLDSRARF